MKVGYLTSDWSNAFTEENDGKFIPGGSAWYRSCLPAQELKKNGYETVVSEQVAVSDRGLVLLDQEGNMHDDIDVIVMQRIMNDFAYNLVRIAQDAGQAVVNDVDDWYWGLHPDNNAYKTTDPNFNQESNRNHYKAAVMASDLVTVSTPYLAEQIESWGCNVKLVRNCIDIERWSTHEQRFSPTIGWVGSTSHRSGDLETVADVIGPFIEDHKLTWHHSGWMEGWPHACRLLNVDVSRSTTSLICSIFNYPRQFAPLDVGIVPLNMVPFNFSKSSIKGMEYAASGVPFVAQATSEYVRLADEIGIGRVASTHEEWESHLEELLDYDVRCKEAAKNRELVESMDISLHWQKWADAYESM